MNINDKCKNSETVKAPTDEEFKEISRQNRIDLYNKEIKDRGGDHPDEVTECNSLVKGYFI